MHIGLGLWVAMNASLNKDTKYNRKFYIGLYGRMGGVVGYSYFYLILMYF